MSVYTFLASDSPFETLIHPRLKYYTYEEAKKLGIDNRAIRWIDSLVEIYGEEYEAAYPKAKRKILHYENEEDLKELRVIPSDVLGSSYGAHGCIPVDMYTPKPYIANPMYRSTPERVQQLIEYIANHLKTATEVELWRTWAGDDFYDIFDITKYKINELTVDHIRNSANSRWTTSGYPPHNEVFQPACLIIER